MARGDGVRGGAAGRGLWVMLVASSLVVPPAGARPLPAKGLARCRPPAPVAVEAAGTRPRPEILDLALHAYGCGQAAGLFEHPILTVIDYSLPSTERRLWVIDLARNRVLFHELVAHGERSGENFAVAFSNQPRSRQSSLGLFRTEDAYLGRHGYSLRLAGLEPGVNDRARERGIVMHAADYVRPAVVAAHGRLGRSWGCPALDPAVHRALIERIQGGTALFAYYPDRRWLDASRFLGCEARLARGTTRR